MSMSPPLDQLKEALASDETASVFIEAFLGLNSEEMKMFLNHLVLKLQFEDLYWVLQKVNQRIRRNGVLDQDHDYSTDLVAVKEEEEPGEHEVESGEHEDIVIKVDPLCQAFESDSEEGTQDQDAKQENPSFNEDLQIEHSIFSIQDNEMEQHEASTSQKPFLNLQDLQKYNLLQPRLVNNLLKVAKEQQQKPQPGLVNIEYKYKVSKAQPFCDKCSETFCSLFELEDHNHKKHKLGLKSLGKHMARWVDSEESKIDKPYKCSLCPKAFISETEMESHEKIYHLSKINDQEFKCLECSITFVSPYKLQRHMRKHSQESIDKKKKFKCDECSKTFRTASKLEIHMRNHTGERPYICSVCPKSFTSAFGATSHEKKYHPKDDDQPFKCDECSINFSTSSKLEDHMRNHTGERPYVCSACPKSFKCKGDVQRHEKAHKDKDTKKFICEECPGRIFYSNGNLNVHKRTHTKEKSYQCDECSKMFAHNNSLQIHIKIHKGIKPFSCQHCEKKFTEQSSLKNHTRIHTGEKPYHCEICGKSFRQSNHYKTHLKTHNGI